MKNITLFENFIKTNEGFATTAGKKFNAYFNELGYENFDEFIEDNQGAAEVLEEWLLKNFPRLFEEFNNVQQADMYFNSLQKSHPYEDFSYKLLSILMKIDGVNSPSHLKPEHQQLLVDVANYIHETY